MENVIFDSFLKMHFMALFVAVFWINVSMSKWTKCKNSLFKLYIYQQWQNMMGNCVRIKSYYQLKNLQNHSFAKRIISLLELLFVYGKKVVVISSRKK